MPGHRMGRVTEDIKRELTAILRTVKDPTVTGMLSIVRCEVSSDLSVAKIFISSMDGFDAAKSAVKGLTHASGYIRRELSLRLSLRHTPQLKFIADDSIAHGADIARMLEDISRRDHGENPDQ
ncbi:30S ribosome-binding factor RbfA [Solibaculum mannosilyticum]|uniref:30S ribosome-binding factor RbfA n=1 Tax=Solibaculum mannosilyticum TaxID=2780922 RepID=UPI000B7FFA94